MFRSHRATIVFALLGGAVAAVVTWVGSLTLGILAGLATWAIAMVALAWAERNGALGPDDPSRRRVLLWSGLGGLAWVVGGAALGRTVAAAMRPDAGSVQENAGFDLGSE